MKHYKTKKRKIRKAKIETCIILIAISVSSLVIGVSAKSLENGINPHTNIKSVATRQISPKKPILAPTKTQVEAEIRKQAKLFSLDPEFMITLAICESQLDYKAKNPNSTARGIFQYLISTWEETESAKKGYERNDFKANIREAMIDISNGESWRWKECLIN